MPARRDLSSRSEGRRPKASQEGTRGGLVGRSAVYGDLSNVSDDVRNNRS